MKQLNPVADGLILSLLREFCPAAASVLDAGCGRGDRLAAIAAALPDARLYGIDRDGENAVLAGLRCPGAEIRTGDVCALPWRDGQFAAALCECTLSLVGDTAAALAELYRVLRPGGVLLLGDLCAEGNAAPTLLGCGTVQRLLFREWLESAVTRAGFRIRAYRDCRDALLTMAAQMLFDGSFAACMDAGAVKVLKEYRAGYGLWVLEKEAEI